MRYTLHLRYKYMPNIEKLQALVINGQKDKPLGVRGFDRY